MKINITKKEYTTLIELLSIADWILDSHNPELPAETGRHRDLIQKFYSLAKEMQCEHLIDHVPSTGEYFPADELDGDSFVRTAITEYEDVVFWESLALHLATRDFAEQTTQKSLTAKPTDEDYAQVAALREKYLDEFEQFGIARLRCPA